jgi:hypothetical protein
MKEQQIILLNKILIGINIFLSLSTLLDAIRLQLTLQYFGIYLTFLEYFIGWGFLASSLVVEYGLFKRKKWAWEGVFLVYIIYFFDKIVGYILGLVMFKEGMALTSMLKYGGVRPEVISFESYAIIGMIILQLSAVIAYFILRSHYKAKQFFKE